MKLAALSGLLRWYPEDKQLVHAGLALKTRGRTEYLRELVLHTVRVGYLSESVPEQAHLIAVIVDQLTELPEEPLQLSLPSDPRDDPCSAPSMPVRNAQR